MVEAFRRVCVEACGDSVRLRDLDGQFICDATKGGRQRSDALSIDGMQGVTFQCPSCGAGCERGEEDGRRFLRGAHYILVMFSNPRGVEAAPPDAHLRNDGTPNPQWKIESGSSLDDLTLSPSINCDVPWKDADGVEHPSSCKFHGFIKNGDAA
jgi:hypothetical protein